jgi:hypothetical protein
MFMYFYCFFSSFIDSHFQGQTLPKKKRKSINAKILCLLTGNRQLEIVNRWITILIIILKCRELNNSFIPMDSFK